MPAGRVRTEDGPSFGRPGRMRRFSEPRAVGVRSAPALPGPRRQHHQVWGGRNPARMTVRGGGRRLWRAGRRLPPRHGGRSGQLVSRDVVPDAAASRALGQQVSDHVAKLLPRSVDLLVPMRERHEAAVVVAVGLVGDECIAAQHGLESLAGAARAVPDLGEVLRWPVI